MNLSSQPPHGFPRLAEIRPPFVAAAGGKAGSLARLRSSGYPVPDGFVIPPSALAGGALAPHLLDDLSASLKVLAGPDRDRARFAVRSSAAAEDSDKAAFAGSFESVLNVPAENVAEAAAQVWRSQFSGRVRSYARSQGLDEGQHMFVLVQRMVPAEVSGVLFTADPMTGSRSAMLGNAAAGLGDRLVSGEVDAVSFHLHRPSGRLEYDIAGTGLTGFEKPARELYRLAEKIERDFASPQDIEWALAGGRVYILQSRPITTLTSIDPAGGGRNDTRLGDYLWTSTNFGEALPDVMTPLTWSMMSLYLGANRLGVETDWFGMGGNIGGRFYMNLSLPASLFTALGFGRDRLRTALAELFGELPEGVEIPVVPKSRSLAVREFFPHALRRARLVGGLKKEIPEYVATGPARVDELKRAIAGCDSPEALRDFWSAQLEPAVRHTMLMLAAGTSDYKNLSRGLRPKLAALVGEADANALMSGRPGRTHLASLGPLIGLSKLETGEMTPAEYLSAYGHRGPSEFELSNPVPAEQADWLDRLTHTSAPAGRSVDELLLQKTRGYEAAWARLEGDHPRLSRRWDRRLAAIDAASQTREAVRSEVVRLLRTIRTYALRAAELTGIGDEVFFLSLDEIGRLLAGDRGVLAPVPSRQETHQLLSALPPYPSFIRGRFDPVAWASDPDRPVHVYLAFGAAPKPKEPADPGAIHGFSGSPGVVEGRVRVLDSIDEGSAFEQGEILVARTTNIGWTPLFPRAAAIVTDVGAPLSHAAIVARELGIPAVVGTGTATARLATGDRVRVDGARGVVAIL